ncbi:tetratricopeptide-like helical domain-containing protein [Tanacetum coccineum]
MCNTRFKILGYKSRYLDNKVLKVFLARRWIDSPRVMGNLFFCHKVLGVLVLNFKGGKVLQEVSTSRFQSKEGLFNHSRIFGRLVVTLWVQVSGLLGFNRQKIYFKRFLGIQVLVVLGRQGAQENREAEVIQESNDHATVAQRKLKVKQLKGKTNTNSLVNKQVHHSANVGAVIMKTGVPGQEGTEGNAAERYRGDNNMAALGVATVIEEYAHESLTFRDAVACEVISKWISVMKEDIVTRSSMCMLSNGFRRSSDDSNIYYWKHAPGMFIYLFLYIDYMGFTCESKAEIWVTKGLLDEAKEIIPWYGDLRTQRVVYQKIMMKKRRVRGHEYMTLTGKLKEDTWLKGLSAESGFELSTLLNGLVGEERILEAEIFFKKLIKDKICEPNVVMYSTMIKGLCKIGNNVIAIQLLRLMDERGCKPDVVVYSNIIDSLCKDNNIDDAFKLFKEMVFQQGISPNVITYSSLIDGLCNLGRWDEASKMLQEMFDVGISPNVHAFSILVDAFCKEAKIEEAENVVDIMLERGIVPDIVTYNSLIDGYYLRGEMSKARTILDSMVFQGVVPDIVTYNSLLNGYWKTLKIDEAMLLFHEMNEKGSNPDAVTYTTMLWGLFRVGNCGAARKLFDEMRAKDALSLFHLMGDSKLNSCINVYTILIDGASKCGKLDIARVLFQDLTNKGLHPDAQTHNVMIGGYCKEGLVCDAKKLFLKMDQSECPPNNVTYNVLLQGCLRNQYYDDIEMLFSRNVWTTLLT